MDQLLLDAIETELLANRPCMLATIVTRAGSAPRGTGTGMVVSSAGEQTGTVGGGALEFRVREDAQTLLSGGEQTVRVYDIHADDANTYSGSVTVLFRPFSGNAGLSLYGRMREAIRAGRDAFLVSRIAGLRAEESRVLETDALMSACGLRCPPEQAVLTQTEPAWLIEPLMPAPRVILFGGGHVAQCMARQLGLLDYRVWVAEDREAFASAALFPSAEAVLLGEYDGMEARLNITKRDHGIVMSRGHETDYQILRWLLRSEADYIGCIGSRKKIALTKERLAADGVTQEQIERLHAPVGLAIGAETPAKIAVSVAAELIRHCACKKSE